MAKDNDVGRLIFANVAESGKKIQLFYYSITHRTRTQRYRACPLWLPLPHPEAS